MSAIFNHEPIFVVTDTMLGELKARAKNAPLLRARICLHSDVEHPVQEMVIAFYKDTYVRPHRHIGASESFHVMEGEIDVIFFDEVGKLTDRVRLGGPETNSPSLYRLSEAKWHSLVVATEYAIVHEVSKGPFRRDQACFAPWSPSTEDRKGIDLFLEATRTSSPGKRNEANRQSLL